MKMESGIPKPSSILKASGIVKPGSISSKFTSVRSCPTNYLQPAKSLTSLNLRSKPEIPKIPLVRNPLTNANQQPLQTIVSRTANRAAMRRSKSMETIRRPVRTDLRTAPVSTFKRPLPPKRPATASVSVEHTAPKVTKTTAPAPRVTKTAAPKIPPYDYKARYNDLLTRHKDLKAENATFKELITDHERIAEEHETLTRQVQIYESELEEKAKKVEAQAREIQDMLSNYNEAKKNVALLSSEKDSLKESLNTLTNHNSIITQQLSHYKELSEKQGNEIIDLKLKNEEYHKLMYNANIERKRLHNDIQDLKGNIRVFCRVRPAIRSEEKKTLSNMVFLDETSLELSKAEAVSSSLSVGGKARSNKLEFTFDQVFDPCTSQDELFLSVSPLIQSALDGYNVCIFAYGQTGSGKTFTMEGDNCHGGKGVIPRTVQLIFESIAALEEYGWSYTVKASFLEIYNEHIFDLLDSSKDQPEHDIRMTDSKGTDVYVTNLREEDISESSQLISLMQQAQRNRATAATENNERSSRSHSVAKIQLIGIHQETKEVLKGCINLVDLAGSESAKNSIRMQETKNINKSLAELGKVILCLQNKSDHIPYRNSRLTFLLMPCLGGNSKTLMFVNVNPLDECYTETVSSLRFAQRVNQVKTGKIIKNRVRETFNLSHC